jgi:DNA-binding NtrC family response regulator
VEKPKVLVIDAYPETQAVLATALAGGGYNVVTAGDVLSGQKLMARERFAFIVLRLRAGKEEDIAVLSRLAALSAGQGLIVAARGPYREVVEALRLGIFDMVDPVPPAARSGEEGAASFDAVIGQARRSLEQGKADQAMVFISQAIVISPERPEIFNLIGAIKEMHGDIDAARRMYRVAVTIEPAYQPAKQNLERTCGWRYDAAEINLGEGRPAGV